MYDAPVVVFQPNLGCNASIWAFQKLDSVFKQQVATFYLHQNLIDNIHRRAAVSSR